MNPILSPGSMESLFAQRVLSAPSFKTALNLTLVTLAIGYALKQGCYFLGVGELYPFYCHSDYAPLYNARQLGGGRFPYTEPPLEYPVGLGLIIWLASTVTPTVVGFWLFNVYLAAFAAILMVWLVWRERGGRALLLAAAPTLALYAFLNWDLVAVACMVGGVVLFLRQRDAAAGLCLGLGTAVKIFPGLLILPFVAQRFREGRLRDAFRVAFMAALVILVLNVPVALAAFDGWAHFFKFSSARGAEWGSVWNTACRTFGVGFCDDVHVMNPLSLTTFLAGALVACVLTVRFAPGTPFWQLSFPLVAVFLLTNKIFSPQHSLWILPWFALVLPDLRLFVAYQVIDIGIYVTSFAWQQRLYGAGGLPLWPLDVFVVLRAALLVWMLITFMRRASPTIATRSALSGAT